MDAVLLSLQGDRAVVDVDGQALSVPKAEVTSLWAGDYLLLWRPPQTWNGLLHEGSQGDAVLWLRTSLAQASGKPFEASENPLFDRALKKTVEEFQRLRAIEPDGVVGAQTMILLNNEIGGKSIPRLTGE